MTVGQSNLTGKKYDSNKPPLQLIPREAVNGIAKAFGYGADKYGRDNFKEGMCWLRLAGGTLRHVFAWISGEDYDDESGLNHLYHAGASICMLIYYTDKGVGLDDRYNETSGNSIRERGLNKNSG